MMKGFEPVTLSWNGENYTVPADKQMMLIAIVEDAISGASGRQPLSILMQTEGPAYSRLATAFGAALRYAGADVTDDAVYLSIVGDLGSGGGAVAIRVQTAILGLLAIIAPPLAREIHAGYAEKKPTPAAKDSSS